MSKRRVRISSSGHIRIDRGRRSSARDTSPPRDRPASRKVTTGSAPVGADSGVSLSADVIERAEIVTEGVFRPGVEDVEVAYLMSGRRPDRLDRVHALASDRIISEATPVSVMTNVNQMIEFVRRSGAADAGVIVELHTHPSSGMTQPSDTDMKSWRSIAQSLAGEFPSARFLFGVHGVARQSPGFLERTSPRRVGLNRLTWQSNTRGHEIALFTSDSSPVEVRFAG